MTATDTSFAPRQACEDPALPGLALGLDPSLVARLLAREGALAPGTEASIRHVRYHPRHGLWISYEARGESRPGRLFYGRIDAPGIEPLAGHEQMDGGNGSLVRLGDIPMVVRFFPHDAVLRRLAVVCELDKIKRKLESVLATEDIEWKIRRSNAATSVVRYKPERRCVLRLELDARRRKTRSKHRLALYGQVDADGTGERVADLLAEFATTTGAMGPLAVPRLVLRAPELGLHVQEEIEGTPLPAHLERDDAKKVVRRLAGRLIDLQRSGARPPRTLAVEDRLVSAGQAAATLAKVPEASARGLADLAAQIHRILADRADPAPVIGCVHGDFHPGQVLVRGRRTWIVDFDSAAVGDPLVDPATFLSGLWLEAGEGRITRESARRAAKIFVRAYAAGWPSAFDATRLRWHLACAFLEAAIAPLRQLQVGWPERVAYRLELAASMVRGAEILP